MTTASDPAGSSPETLFDAAAEAWEAAVFTFADQLRPAFEDLAEAAAEGVGVARDAIVESARRRPVASVIAALGAGVLIGWLIAGRSR